ncbi:MAG: FliA/WhiG family RNA polymerase sigma factor [Deltaproteobacteria bacterium]|nr:FliA/WhiG family RNA polymerase sigma factor [Deltaproteobacteria bacterium]
MTANLGPAPAAALPLAPVDYLPFVRKVVSRLARRLPSHVRIDDLMGAGVVGLLEAFDRYDPTRVTNFETFAEFRVKGALLDELRRRDLMARDARLAAKQIERSIAALTVKLGRPPEEAEIALHLQLSVGELRARLQKLIPVQVLSLDEVREATLASRGLDPFEAAARAELSERLAGAIDGLPQRQRQVLQLYYREELTLREIGTVLGVTESRICQILSETTLRLRAVLGLGAGGETDGEASHG